MIPFDDALGATLKSMGLAEPALMLDLEREWAVLAGEPWSSTTRPLYVRGQVLVVEARVPGSVSFLRYEAGELERRLAARFGPVAITSVEIRAVQRRSGTAL